MKGDDRLKFEVLSSVYLHKKKWLTIRQDHVRLTNGAEMPEYYIAEHPDWVNVIAETEEGMLVLVRQYRHGIEQVSFELCAGVVDAEDGSPLVAAQRELLEETGYGGGIWTDYMKISPNPATHTNINHCFLAKGVRKLKEPHQEATEMIDVYVLSPDKVCHMLQNNEFIQSLHAAPLWKYFAESGTMPNLNAPINLPEK